MNNNMPRLTIEIDGKIREEFIARLREDDMKIAQFFRQCIKKYLKEKKKRD